MIRQNSRMTYRIRFFPILFFMICSACSQQVEQRAEFFVFGTLVEVVVRNADPDSATQAFAVLQQRFQLMHRDWHAWEAGALAEINTAFATGQQAAVTEDIRYLILQSQQLEAQSEGRFNAALGGLIGLWGFHTSDYPVTSPPPDDADIQDFLKAAPSANDIIFSGELVSSTNPSVQLDFGAIAKGYAVDIALEILAQHGITNALVNAGGDLRASGGTKVNPWKVGIRNPGGGVIGGIEIVGDEAVFTSGVDQRYLEQSGLRYPHILDPYSGHAVKGVASVTVIADRGYFADAAATALIVAGVDSWQELAVDMGLKEVLLIDDQGEIFMTPEMRDRLKLEPGVELRAHVSGRD
jgi:thiamine biosynthesis lipoprotein